MAVESTRALLTPLLEEEADLRRAYRRRVDPFQHSKIGVDDEASFVAQGWTVHKRLKSAVWIRKEKSKQAALADRLWCLLFRMGYTVLNGTNFSVQIKKQDNALTTKKIDVFSKDTETAIVIECRARDTLGRRNLQKDIQEASDSQKQISQSIRTQFGPGYKPKILWIFATENVIWNEKDIAASEAANIHVVTENELQYFDAFVSHIGSAGRYQFLAEFLEGQEIPHLSDIRIPATRGYFGKHKYYSFTISAKNLLKIAFVNHQALNHPEGRPAYQRMINKNRIRDIGLFIQSGGFFPTNILVNFTESCRFDLLSNKDTADKNIDFGWLYLPRKYKICLDYRRPAQALWIF